MIECNKPQEQWIGNLSFFCNASSVVQTRDDTEICGQAAIHQIALNFLEQSVDCSSPAETVTWGAFHPFLKFVIRGTVQCIYY